MVRGWSALLVRRDVRRECLVSVACCCIICSAPCHHHVVAHAHVLFGTVCKRRFGELKGAPKTAWLFFIAMFVFYIAAIATISLSN